MNQRWRHDRVRSSPSDPVSLEDTSVSDASNCTEEDEEEGTFLVTYSSGTPSTLVEEEHLPCPCRWLYLVCVTVPMLLLDFLRLCVFVILLAPAFASFCWFYFTCDRQVVPYNTSLDASRRHTLDLYGGTSHSHSPATGDKPVLLFFTGGAWVIGYKMWGAFLARVLTAMGVIVVVPDYRNYPQAAVPGMVDDVRDAIQWTLDHIHEYGGNPQHVLLAGQSAGGHLASVVLLQKALQIARHGHVDGFQPQQLLGVCSISAPLSVQAMATTFQNHGLTRDFVHSLFGAEGTDATIAMEANDPQHLLEQLQQYLLVPQDPSRQFTLHNTTLSLNQLLPRMCIFHGTADRTVPCQVSEQFATSLRQGGLIGVEYIAYQDWSHTDPILEAIIMADHQFHTDLYQRLYQWIQNSSNYCPPSTTMMPDKLDETMPECQPLCPAPLVKAARFCNPF
jgi:acetyl esterase/lipase